jgi:hypothetical protein
MVVTTNTITFLGLTPFNSAHKHRGSGETYCLYIQYILDRLWLHVSAVIRPLQNLYGTISVL